VETYEGQWTHTSTVGSSKGPVFYNADIPKEEVTVKPVEEQGEWESRRLWQTVAKGIRSGDYDLAGRDKSRIENEQRQKRKDEQAEGKTWPSWHFEHVESDPDYQVLAALMNDRNLAPIEDAYVFKTQ
jgi:hypothetical protein